MTNITISELRPIETEFEELSDLELEAVLGGKRHVDKYDLDGDGKWDVKVVSR